jgi:hypothetical protein
MSPNGGLSAHLAKLAADWAPRLSKFELVSTDPSALAGNGSINSDARNAGKWLVSKPSAFDIQIQKFEVLTD